MLPNQLKFDLTYNFNKNLSLKFGKELGDLNGVVQKINKKFRDFSFKNKNEYLTFESSGIDFSDRIIIAAIGYNAAARKKVKVGIQSITDQSHFYKVSPTIMMLITIDLDGNIEANITQSFDYSSYIDKGINIQKNGYDDGHGTVESNKSKDHHFNLNDHSIDIKNIEAKSKEEINETPVYKTTLKASGKYEYLAALDGNVCLMIDGIIPCTLSGRIGSRGNGSFNGDLTVEKGKGNVIKSNFGCYIKNEIFMDLRFIFRYAFKLKIPNFNEKPIKKEWSLASLILFPLQYSTYDLKGLYYWEGKNGNVPIPNANVKIKGEKKKEIETTTDKNGEFIFNNLFFGKYDIKISKEGYETVEKQIEFDENSLTQNFITKKSNINELKGYWQGTYSNSKNEKRLLTLNFETINGNNIEGIGHIGSDSNEDLFSYKLIGKYDMDNNLLTFNIPSDNEDNIDLMSECTVKVLPDNLKGKFHKNDLELDKVDNIDMYGFTSYKGHFYKLINKHLSWKDAEDMCEKMGGHLATITSQEEQDFVEKIADGTCAWIGGYRDNDNQDSWKWVTEEKWDYTNWGYGEPNNSNNVISNENKVSIWPREWNDLNEDSYEQSGYICEIE